MKWIKGIAVFLVVVFGIQFSCTRGAIPYGASPQITDYPGFSDGIITFFSGDISKNGSSVEIGDIVTKDDVISTGGDSYCEIQFGSKAVIRIQADSRIKMRNILSEPGKTDIQLELSPGKVLCKVNKLLTNENFSVHTQAAVCGVRGTEFLVAENPDGDTGVAVKEGEVLLKPSSLKTAELLEKTDDQNRELTEAVEEIEKTAISVKSGQEAEINKKTAEKIGEIFDYIEKSIDEILADEEISEKKLIELREMVSEKKEEILSELGLPENSTAKTREELEDLEKIKEIDLTSDKNDSPKSKLAKINILINPKDALITLNSDYLGKGSFSGLYTYGQKLSFKFKKPGYVEKVLEIEVSNKVSPEYRISLEIDKGVKGTIVLKKTGSDGSFSIFMDGISQGKNVFTIDNVNPGSHKIEIKQERMLGEEIIFDTDVVISSDETISVTFNVDEITEREREKLKELENAIKKEFDSQEAKDRIEDTFNEAMSLLDNVQENESIIREKQKFKTLYDDYLKQWIIW